MFRVRVRFLRGKLKINGLEKNRFSDVSNQNETLTTRVSNTDYELCMHSYFARDTFKIIFLDLMDF